MRFRDGMFRATTCDWVRRAGRRIRPYLGLRTRLVARQRLGSRQVARRDRRRPWTPGAGARPRRRTFGTWGSKWVGDQRRAGRRFLAIAGGRGCRDWRSGRLVRPRGRSLGAVGLPGVGGGPGRHLGGCRPQAGLGTKRVGDNGRRSGISWRPGGHRFLPLSGRVRPMDPTWRQTASRTSSPSSSCSESYLRWSPRAPRRCRPDRWVSASQLRRPRVERDAACSSRGRSVSDRVLRSRAARSGEVNFR